MDYARQSSQPATVDLVRADLAEIWSIKDSEVQSPQRAPSVSAVSDMLDLEFLSTPGPRPSKTTKNDPLPDILGDYLELSPSHKRGRSDRRGNIDESPKQGTDASSGSPESPKPRHHRSSADTDHERRLSDQVAGSHNPANQGSPLQGAKKQGDPSNVNHPPAKANKRKHHNQQTAEIESPSNSPIPKPTRQRQPKHKTVPTTTRKGPPKVSKQPKALAETVNAGSKRTKAKGRSHDDDLFDLSDVTDSETEERPKKRQAKQTPPKEPSALSARKSQADKSGGHTVKQGAKPTRVAKKPPSRVVPQQDRDKNDVAPTRPSTTAPVGVEEKSRGGPSQHEDDHTPTVAKGVSNEPARIEPPVSDTKNITAPRTSSSPQPLNPSPASMVKAEPVLPVSAKPLDVIVLSSEGVETDNAFAPSTSPMFVEQNHDPVAANPACTHAITVDSENSDQRSPIRLPVIRGRLGFTPPTSFQPHALGNSTESPRKHNTKHQLPADIRNAFFDEQPIPISPPAAPELEHCSEEESFFPEDVWKQAVEDDSPPAVLHRIVTLLHRSLKPREQIVRDIAADYQENALRLLANLGARHEDEKRNTLAALRKASRTAFSVFSGAGHDIALLINSLRDMNITYTADVLTRPVLAQKLDVVTRLCETKLGNYIQSGPFGDDAASEPEDNHDRLAATYRIKLLEAVQRSDGQTPDAFGKVDLQAVEFVKRCLHGETKKVQHTESKKPNAPSRNADQALEVLLDGIINTMQGRSDDATSHQATPESVVTVASGDSDMADVGF